MNRLRDLDRELVRQGRDRAPAATLTRRARTAPRARATAMGAVDYTVPGHVPVQAQATSLVCWATVTAMLMGWRDSMSYVVDRAMDVIDTEWGDMVRANRGLLGRDKARFLASAGLQAEPPMSLTVEAWDGMLRRFGPLWITTDEDPTAGFSIHARILTGIRGDGTAAGTVLTFIDPAGGRVVSETLERFLPKFESEASTPGRPLRIQVVHWPESVAGQVRLGTAQSVGRGAIPAASAGMSTASVAPRPSAFADASVAQHLAAVGLDITEFEPSFVDSMQAQPAIDWCRVRHGIIRSAVEVQGDWLNATGGMRNEGDPSVRDLLVMFWRDGVGMNEQQAQATAAISAADHPTQAVWSAAFVSWCVRNALPDPPPPHNGGFTFHMRHMAYIADALRNRENNDPARPFWLYDINDPGVVPEDGDILCLNRRDGNGVWTQHSFPSIRQQWVVNQPHAVATGSSHCDVVVGQFDQGGRRWIETIGGNVGDTVGSTRYSVGPDGRLQDTVDLNGVAVAGRGDVTQAVGNRPAIVFGLIRLTACPNFGQ